MSGRWIWNEKQQFARQLARNLCIEMEKLPEGNFGKLFLLTMDDGKKVIARLPNPNAWPAHYATASEVAIMEFVWSFFTFLHGIFSTPPTQRIQTWNSFTDNEAGAEYIIMERSRGIQLSKVWETLKGPEKLEIVNQIAGFKRSMVSATHFSLYGILYFAKDLPNISASQHVELPPTKQTGHPGFVIGCTTNRPFFDDG
ncbi:hypothetical protein FQN57_000029 [Myotisia sp. PD_48]|nr:hypothetical protein FQN57_000029 [Myotisia sp. PD_48]